jgi:predicted MPP superfamily phosphohydrolase
MTAVGVGVAVGSLAHGSLYGRHHVEITRGALPVVGLDPALAGVRVGFITDTHHSDFTSAAFIGHAVALLQAEQPDLIVLGGDYVTQRDRRYIPASAQTFATLTAPHGVFAVLGNHDDDSEVPRALGRAGVEVLRDARTTLRVRGAALDLIGLRYWTRGRGTLARLADGSSPSTLLLAHDPRRFIDAAALGLPAVLAGHTHGGQVRLPLLGAVAARKFPIAAGLLTSGTTSLFVSRGIGTVYVPCRVNCPPEVVVLTLHAAPLPSSAQRG